MILLAFYSHLHLDLTDSFEPFPSAANEPFKLA